MKFNYIYLLWGRTIVAPSHTSFHRTGSRLSYVGQGEVVISISSPSHFQVYAAARFGYLGELIIY